MSVHATWFIDWFFVSSSSSSCEATAIIVLIILSLYRGSAVRKHTHTKKQQQQPHKYCFGLLQCGGSSHKCVDGLGLRDFLGRSFQSLMVLSRNEYCWYWVLQCCCENCWLCLCRWRGWGWWWWLELVLNSIGGIVDAVQHCQPSCLSSALEGGPL